MNINGLSLLSSVGIEWYRIRRACHCCHRPNYLGMSCHTERYLWKVNGCPRVPVHGPWHWSRWIAQPFAQTSPPSWQWPSGAGSSPPWTHESGKKWTRPQDISRLAEVCNKYMQVSEAIFQSTIIYFCWNVLKAYRPILWISIWISM